MVATSTLSNLRTSSKDEYGLPFKVFGVNRHGVIVLQHCMWDEGAQKGGSKVTKMSRNMTKLLKMHSELL